MQIKEVKLTFAYTCDWEAIYIDDRLLIDGSSITAYDLARLLLEQHHIDDLEQFEVSMDRIKAHGYKFPQRLEGLKCADILEKAGL